MISNNSISELVTSIECDTGFFVGFLFSKLYKTLTFVSAIFNFLFDASISISTSTLNPFVLKSITPIAFLE